MSKTDPKVTVLMPVYNGEKYLNQAIDSILTQTFSDFEFLIIEDGSTDQSAEIIKSYSDSRIKLVCNDKNLKLAATLDKGLELSRGEYVARMDCDDISLRERLERQVEYLNSNNDICLVGSGFKLISDNKVDVISYEFSGIRKKILKDSPVNQI